jgi:2-(1,2-epoxy-1,2-dihydrophenyl)acetyl-CoA isomerase
MEETLKWECTDGIGILTFNRPESFNAFDLDMMQSFSEKMVEITRDPRVTGLILAGSGKAFCAGGDLRWLSGFGKSYGETFHILAARYHQAMLEIRRMPKPVVAAIHGLAAGGGFSMALACDFRIMEKSAVLRQAYTSNGLSIDGGGTFTLPRLVGLARALEIAAFDRPMSAEQALDWGLVTELAPDGQALSRAKALVEEIRKGPLSSFAASKRLLTDAFDTPLEAQLENERALLAWTADHPNGQEGVRAFLEKRKPSYR